MRLGLSKEELLGGIGEYDAIITRSGTTVDKALLDAATKLKIVARAGVGIDNVDVDYASSKGVIVVNAPFGNTNSAAEHTMALLLGLLPQCHQGQQQPEIRRMEAGTISPATN